MPLYVPTPAQTDSVPTPLPTVTHEPGEELLSTAVSKRPWHFGLKFMLLTPWAFFVGPNYWVGSLKYERYFQYFILVCTIVFWAVLFQHLIPDYNATCCVKTHVTRTDLGDCDDPLGKLFKETVGISSVKQECRSYPWDIRILLIAYYASLALLLILYVMQFEQCYLANRSAIKKLDKHISIKDMSDSKRRTLCDAVIFCTRLHTSESEHLFMTYFNPDSLFLSYPLVAFHGLFWVFIQLSLSFVAFGCVLYYFLIYDKLYDAWCCYPRGTSFLHYTKGICHGQCPSRDLKSWIPLMIAGGCVVLRLLTQIASYLTTRHYTDNIQGYVRKHFSALSEEIKTTLISYAKREGEFT